MQPYIATDPLALLKAEAAVRDMGRSASLSALLLDGPPGTGKTYLAKSLAKQLNARLLQFQFFPGVGREELLLDQEIGGQGQRIPGLLLQAITLSEKQKVVLLLDEMDKAEPKVDSFLLNFLTEGEIFLPQLGLYRAQSGNLLVILTKNDERAVSPPLLRRCRSLQMSWPSLETELLILNQSFPDLPREVGVALIEPAHRLRHHPDVHKAPSTPELIRLLRDLLHLVQQQTPTLLLGLYYIDSIAPIPRDRQHILDSPTYLGTRLQRALSGYLQQAGNRL